MCVSFNWKNCNIISQTWTGLSFRMGLDFKRIKTNAHRTLCIKWNETATVKCYCKLKSKSCIKCWLRQSSLVKREESFYSTTMPALFKNRKLSLRSRVNYSRNTFAHQAFQTKQQKYEEFIASEGHKHYLDEMNHIATIVSTAMLSSLLMNENFE